MPKTKTFDPACFDLAERFLADEPLLNTEAAKTTLAARIQEAIEDEIDFMQNIFQSSEHSR